MAHNDKPVVEPGARPGPPTKAELRAWFNERLRVRHAEEAAKHTGCTPEEAAARFRSGYSIIQYSSGRHEWRIGTKVGKLWRE
jgi:hypothetical protein